MKVSKSVVWGVRGKGESQRETEREAGYLWGHMKVSHKHVSCLCIQAQIFNDCLEFDFGCMVNFLILCHWINGSYCVRES